MLSKPTLLHALWLIFDHEFWNRNQDFFIFSIIKFKTAQTVLSSPTSRSMVLCSYTAILLLLSQRHSKSFLKMKNNWAKNNLSAIHTNPDTKFKCSVSSAMGIWIYISKCFIWYLNLNFESLTDYFTNPPYRMSLIHRTWAEEILVYRK